MIRLAFRFDDPSASSNQEVEARILASLARYGLCATFAVIPFSGAGGAPLPLARERARPLREAVRQGVLDVALHGHSHIDANTDDDGHPSEFVGVPAVRQRELIAAGKALLEAVFERPITGFVPPWNSYDAGTLDALEQTGFSHLSSNTRYAPMRATPLRVLPLTCHLHRLEAAIAEARRFARLQPVIVVVMHHYDFPGGATPVFADYAAFDALLARLAAEADIQVKTLGELAAELTPAASRRGFRHLQLRDRLPWRFRHWLPDLCCATRPLFLP